MKDGSGSGGPPKPYSRPSAAGKINLTDPDSRNVKTLRGGCRATTPKPSPPEQIVIAAEVTVDSPDFGHLEPMVTAASELATGRDRRHPEVVLADAGYWHTVQLQALMRRPDRGADRDAKKRKGARPGWDGGLYAFMRRVLANPTGAQLYGKRTAMERHLRLAHPVRGR